MLTPFNTSINYSMAYSRFVNAFSRISKNYDFRLQICCHFDLVLSYFCAGEEGWGWGKGAAEQCTHSKVKFKGNNVQASAQYGQSLRCPTDGTAHNKDSDQTGRMPILS